MTWKLVGRADELTRGLDGLERARLVAFTGAPGTGKSRLLDELVDRVEVTSRPVYRVLATAATDTVAFGPFVSLFPDPPPRNPSLLLATVVEAIDAAGGESGLLVAIDDAHHLDDGSLALLAVIIASSSAQIALTTSDDHERPQGLADLLRDDRAVCIDVGPLAREDVDHLVEVVLGPVDAHLSDELWRLCQGNPLVLREVLAGAHDRLGRNDTGRWTATGSLVGRRIGDLARQRVAALDEDVAEALTLVALAAPVSLDVVVAAVGASTLDALQAASLAEVVELGHHQGRVVRPAHPLYGEVLRSTLGAGTRGRLCRKLVDAVIASGAKVDPLRVAMWQHNAEGTPDQALAVAGAGMALARHDPNLALDLIDQVADLVDQATLALLRGSALIQQGRHDEAGDVLAAGCDVALARFTSRTTPATSPDSRDLASLAADLASVRSFNLAFGLRRPDEADAVLAAATTALGDAGVQGRLDAERGIIAAIGGDLSLSLASARRAIENPEADDATLLSAHVSLTLAETMLGRVGDIEDHARRGVALAASGSNTLPLARDQILVMDSVAAFLAGDLGRASAIISQQIAHGRRLTVGLWLSTSAVVTAHEGRLRDAERSAAAALDHPELDELLDLRGFALGILGMVEGQLGNGDRLDELEELRDRYDEPRNAVWLDRGRAWTLAARGEFDAAVAMAHAGGTRGIEGHHVAWGVQALHDAIRMGQGAEVAEVAAELSRAVATTDGAGLLEAMNRHAVALVDENIEDLTRAAASFASMGANLFAADTVAQASKLAELDGDQGLSTRCTALSMAWELRCPGMQTPALARRPAIALSPRVIEIALDAAAGLSSADIAERRFLSVRTVDNHLRSVYRNLGVSGRLELAEVLSPFS